MNLRRLAITLCASFLVAMTCHAQEMLVSTEWLANNLNNRDLVILHVGQEKDYEEGHIPGAQLITLDDIGIRNAEGLSLEMPPVATVEKAFGERGIGNGTRVVLYHGTRSVQSATRVWFTFDYLGASQNVSLLDGGLALWQAENRPVTKEKPKAIAKTFQGAPREGQIVSIDWLKEHLNDPGVQLFDARTPNFYSGADKGMMPRAGHIPGAANVPYPSFFGDDGRMKSRSELAAMLSLRDDKKSDAVRVTYCHIGQQATVPYFVARMLGLNVKLFDGSFQEWSNRDDLPVEAPAATAQ